MNKKYKIISVIALVVLIFFVMFLQKESDGTWVCKSGVWVKHGSPSAPAPTEPCGEKTKIDNFEKCLQAGFPIMESYPRKCQTPAGEMFVEDVGNELDKSDLIRVDNPRPNQTIGSPLLITGQARGYWFFEASFPIKVFDENNNLLTTIIAQAQSDWMTEDFVPFEAKLDFPLPESGEGRMVFQKDNPSGLPENDDELVVPIKFGGTAELMKVKVYFNNSRMDPEVSCNKVFPVEREVAKTQAVARVALDELLAGIKPNEENQGFFTSINPGVKINSLTIADGVAKVDFDKQMGYQVGGSCRVSAIRAQITETLKQFPTVKQVIISVNGNTEEALQP